MPVPRRRVAVIVPESDESADFRSTRCRRCSRVASRNRADGSRRGRRAVAAVIRKVLDGPVDPDEAVRNPRRRSALPMPCQCRARRYTIRREEGHQMHTRRAKFALALVSIWTLSSVGVAIADLNTGYPAPPTGPIVDVSAAPVIVIGTTLSTQSAWTVDRTSIQTRTQVRVDQVVRGNPPTPLTIDTSGGSADGIQQWVEHEPTFVVGEQSRLFLTQLSNGDFAVVGATKVSKGLRAAATHL